MKLLICITKAHNITEFDNAVNECLSSYDKLWVCYYNSYEARQIIKDYFLKYDEYTHLVILPDDMIVNQSAIDLLINNLEDGQNYQVLVGCCNVDNKENRDKLNVSLQVIHPKRVDGTYYYNFITVFDTHLIGRPQPTRVYYQGDAFLILRRDVVDKLSFDTDYKLNEIEPWEGCCNDVVMSWELSELGIPIYCNLKARFQHLKLNDLENYAKKLVGEETSYTHFVRARGT